MSEYVGSWLGKGVTPPKEKGEGRTNNISLPTNRIEFCSVTKFYLSFKRELTFTGRKIPSENTCHVLVQESHVLLKLAAFNA